MGHPNVSADAQAAFDVLKNGGVTILPMDVGYSLIGGSEQALKTIFDTKGRAKSKLNAMLADDILQGEIHILDNRGQEILQALTVDYDLPLGAIAESRMDHPILQKMTKTAMEGSSKTGTILMLVNAGSFHAEICKLSREHIHPLFGSSANLSLSGTKFRVSGIESEIISIADIIIDHGLRKYHLYQASSTLLNLNTLEVIRFGSCYELIWDILKRHFSIELPKPPDGHLANLIGNKLL